MENQRRLVQWLFNEDSEQGDYKDDLSKGFCYCSNKDKQEDN